MTRKLFVGAIAAGALVVTTGTALALSSDDATTPAAQVTTSTSMPTDMPTAAQPGSLTADDASRIVIDRFGGTVREVELEFEHGRVEWKVEITDPDGVAHDVRVGSASGAITGVDRDDDDEGFDYHGGHDRGGDDHGGDRHGGDDH